MPIVSKQKRQESHESDRDHLASGRFRTVGCQDALGPGAGVGGRGFCKERCTGLADRCDITCVCFQQSCALRGTGALATRWQHVRGRTRRMQWRANTICRCSARLGLSLEELTGGVFSAVSIHRGIARLSFKLAISTGSVGCALSI